MTGFGNGGRRWFASGLGLLFGVVIGTALFEGASGVAFGVAMGTTVAIAFGAMDGRGSAENGPEGGDSAMNSPEESDSAI
ncbi:hypothetical protein [Micromonospora sp. KC721]|uniref:hypothetical protein n=1 Tax=Micromonospora sp. KC721 TaxID=2530380 RepID=UPI001053742C|nr:hypothetical protein [Micromonospora sp. KC721]TDB70846.1 hypothetical protein E1182_26395 [Micromonospora sp. KC721]